MTIQYPTRYLQYVISFCLMIILLCSLLMAARTGIAAVGNYFTGHAWSVLRNKSFRLSQSDAATIRKQYEQVLSYDRDNPDIWRQLGALQEATVSFLPVGDPAAMSARQKAHDYYLQALTLRPGWPYYWADLMLVKYRMNDLDDEFQNAMQNALMQGPWEFLVLYLVAEIGMHRWDDLPDAMQEQTLGTINRGIVHRDGAQAMLDLVKRYDMLERVCTHPLDDFLVRKYCQQEMPELSR